MRAERLVAIALLLQAHGQMTVSQLARRLEVSDRTVRRDLDALLLSGLPVYSQRGRGGGWALVDGHAINLSALTAEEAQALFLVTGPELLAGLGLDGLTSALRKLLAALPATTREQAGLTRRAIHIDPTRWGQPTLPAPPALAPLRAAVVAGVQVDLTYANAGEDAIARRVHPYGLVSKSGVWYLVAGTDSGLRTFRVSRVVDAAVTTEAVERPDDFDLVRAWEDVNRRRGPCSRERVKVEFQVRPDVVAAVSSTLPEHYRLQPVDGPSGQVRRFVATFPSVHEAACELIYLGEGVRVLEPPAVRAEMVRIGHRLIAAHAPDWPRAN
ncbi:Predicted DNA-binding transcriptional regulator YafY, contains an HTH and WYL domains [Actinopolymorpha cephalotaxi]|uniref:DNA-binding transcriptional regulator YafY n=1 Tax=Actinopolymorpha cephalotaxi TaxID=504797 RepID=A0A1I2WWQ8_9ACTN|nr:WYL domain-containing protein [Actinopolymorpha cephalotaxi]NYH85129.1 putative DNA-binding transcriptional regulator YafY [Actinopolymorpha cephalotaxi]SFH04826.1 Predicted DNA-binding transcriptional regulator YafY, contains an HTH and WYL domains [Actinopolymorpha cephalotaxi]